MERILSADDQPNDSFGYSCYTVVLPAPREIAARGNRIEQESGMSRAKIPAHITVKGTFSGIASLEEVQRTLRSITEQTAPFQVSFAGASSSWGSKSGWLLIPVTQELQTLHDVLVTALAPLGTQAYRDDPYRAHLTYVQDVSPEGLARAQALVAATEFGEGFQAEAIDLMGRTGPAHGGRWLLIERFPLLG